MENIEVEVRSFVTKEKYDDLKEFFDKNAKFLKEDNQVTHYLNAGGDLRIQKNDFFSKIWFKKGKIHDEMREEHEIRLQKEQFDDLEKLFLLLDYKTKIKWIRKRLQYEWKGTTVCLDYTKGYGYILELEKMSSETEKEKSLSMLKMLMKELNIEITPKSEFDEKYKYYEENWEKLVQ